MAAGLDGGCGSNRPRAHRPSPSLGRQGGCPIKPALRWRSSWSLRWHPSRSWRRSSDLSWTASATAAGGCWASAWRFALLIWTVLAWLFRLATADQPTP